MAKTIRCHSISVCDGELSEAPQAKSSESGWTLGATPHYDELVLDRRDIVHQIVRTIIQERTVTYCSIAECSAVSHIVTPKRACMLYWECRACMHSVL
jgi:hypothetical protein